MLAYSIRRVLIGMVTLLLVSMVIYTLIRSMPGDPIAAQMAQSDPGRKQRKQDYERARAALHLDKPIPYGYAMWLGGVVTKFDFGLSITRHVPVSRLIRERIGATLSLTLTSLLLAYVLSVPLGLYSTARSGRLDERSMSLLLYMLYSLPTFVAALFLQSYLHVKLQWLPLFGMVGDDYESLSTFGKAWDLFQHALLPVACFTYGSLAYEARFIRSNMHEVIRQDYIRTARAKGVGPFGVIVVHGFRNTLIPFVTLVGLTLPALLSGSVILEQIFTWPGMGNLFFDSIRERDYHTIMGLTMMFSLMTLAGTLLADLLYAVVDPRVSYS